MNRVMAELLESFMRSNPQDPIADSHRFLEYIMEEGFSFSEFEEKDLWEVAERFGLSEAEATDLIEDAAMWLT